MTVQQTPENFCFQCKHYDKQLNAEPTCDVDAYVTRNPVDGKPQWIGLVECKSVRIYQDYIKCRRYQDAS